MLTTKEILCDYLLNNDYLDSNDLSKELLEWLDTDEDVDTDDVKTIGYDTSGQGGSIIWTKYITINNYTFELYYATFGKNIRDTAPDGVGIDTKQITDEMKIEPSK